MKTLLLTIVCICLLASCAADQATKQMQAEQYKAYLDAATKEQPLMEFKGHVKIEADSVVIHAPQGTATSAAGKVAAYRAPMTAAEAISTALTSVVYKAADVGTSFLPWYSAGKELGDVLKKALDNSGHNSTVTGSYNQDRHDSGDFRDIGTYQDDRSNRSISNSYNPVDRHDTVTPVPVVVQPVTVIEPVITE